MKIISGESPNLARYALKKIEEITGRKISKQLRIKVVSQIPVGCGMGSSAALAVSFTGAILKLINHPWSRKRINEIAYELEKNSMELPAVVIILFLLTVVFFGLEKKQKSLKSFPVCLSRLSPNFFN